MRRFVAALLWWFWIGFLIYGIVKWQAPIFYAIIPLCWLIFIVYWWVTSMRVKPTAEKQSVASAMAHRLPVGLSWLLLLDWKLPYPMNITLVPRESWLLIAGVVICMLGLFETIWARTTLAGNWSSDVTFKQGHELIRTGPYRFTRHPIYTGILLMALGTAIDIGTVRGFFALFLMTIGFWIKLKQEEQLMMQHFPGQYPAYRKEVKALVPFIF